MLTKFRDINICDVKMLYFRKLRMVLNLENFEKLYNLALFKEHFHQYFEMLLHAIYFRQKSLLLNKKLIERFIHKLMCSRALSHTQRQDI